MSEKIQDIGEEELLNRLKKFVTFGQIDDDTAEIKFSHKNLLINTDLLVEDVHFSDLTASPKDIGWKAITSNVSDLIGSGSKEILGFTVGLVVPKNTTWDWVEGVYEGISTALQYFGGSLLGGDCSNGQQKMLSITAIGKCSELRLHRSNALPGDYLITNGNHGLSRLGLAILTSDPAIQNVDLSEELIKKALLAHQRPEPSKKTIYNLIDSKPKSTPWRAAGTDSSDGLIKAVQNLCQSSGCQAVLKRESMPKDRDWPVGDLWDNWCLFGGEDYQLVMSLPKAWALEFLKKEKSAKLLGFIQSGKPSAIWNDKQSINNSDYQFNHF